MAVVVHGVGGAGGVVEDKAVGGVGTGLIDVPFGMEGIRIVAFVREKEERVVVVGAERRIVHRPDPVARAVLSKANSHFDGGARLRCGRDRIVRGSLIERVLRRGQYDAVFGVRIGQAGLHCHKRSRRQAMDYPLA